MGGVYEERRLQKGIVYKKVKNLIHGKCFGHEHELQELSLLKGYMHQKKKTAISLYGMTFIFVLAV